MDSRNVGVILTSVSSPVIAFWEKEAQNDLAYSGKHPFVASFDN
jgi:hypothetical protein